MASPDLGSLDDLEQRAQGGRQTLGDALQAQQTPAAPDPLDVIKQQLAQKYQSLTPKPASGGPIRRLLQNFLSGGGEALMHQQGIATPQEEQDKILSQMTQISNAQSNDEYRKALAQQFEMVDVPLPNGETGQLPRKFLGQWMAAQAGAQSRVEAAKIGAQGRENVAEINAQNKRPSAASRDDRFIQLSGVDPSTWSADDKRFMTGYAKYVDFTKVQPGVERAKIFAAPRWASLDPERQAQIAMARSMATGVYANQLTSFNAFLGHLGDLKDSVETLQNTDARFINMPLNRIKIQTGDPKIQEVIAKMEPVRKEFESLLLNNRALYEMDRKSADIILSQDSSPAQLQTAMKSLAATASIRLGAVNSTIKRVTGSDIPEIVEPSNGSVLEEFGQTIPGYGGGQTFSGVFKSPQGPANRKPQKPPSTIVKWGRDANGNPVRLP